MFGLKSPHKGVKNQQLLSSIQIIVFLALTCFSYPKRPVSRVTFGEKNANSYLFQQYDMRHFAHLAYFFNTRLLQGLPGSSRHPTFFSIAEFFGKTWLRSAKISRFHVFVIMYLLDIFSLCFHQSTKKHFLHPLIFGSSIMPPSSMFFKSEKCNLAIGSFRIP